MLRLCSITLMILMVALTSCGSTFIILKEDENIPFNLLPIKQFLSKKIVVILYTNATSHLIKSFFLINKEEQVTLFNTDLSSPFRSIGKTKYGIFVLVFFKKETKKQFKEIIFSNGDLFIYVECEKYNYTERQKICQNGLSIPNIAALYNTYNESFHVCRYYYKGQAVSVVEVGKNSIPPKWKILNTYSNFQKYQLRIGYIILSPHIFRQV